MAVALFKLQKRHIHTVNLTVSNYSSYAQFLEKFAEKVLRAAGPWDRVKDWISKFGRQVKPDINYNLSSGEVNVSLGKGAVFDPTPIAPDVFALSGELTKKAGFRMAICLDEFHQISQFNGGSVENAIRNQGQEQREVGYVFAGSQLRSCRRCEAGACPLEGCVKRIVNPNCTLVSAYRSACRAFRP